MLTVTYQDENGTLHFVQHAKDDAPPTADVLRRYFASVSGAGETGVSDEVPAPPAGAPRAPSAVAGPDREPPPDESGDDSTA